MRVRRTKPSPQVSCPTCGNPFQVDMKSPWMPFCSERCKSIDLKRLLNQEIGLPYTSSNMLSDDIESPSTVDWRTEIE